MEISNAYGNVGEASARLMAVAPQAYLLPDAEYIPSPNCDEFPDLAEISLIVVHAISLPAGQYGGNDVIRLFTNQLGCSKNDDYADLAGLKVSSHFFIRRDGELIQFVPLNKRAWHAGVSEFSGQTNCNDFAIGIELEGAENDPFTEQQYQQLASLTQKLFTFYPKITTERIVGHADIAPGRKWDPGNGFNWQKYFALLH